MKFPVKFIIALCALIIGVIGVIVCVLPQYGAEKVVYDYISAAKSGDAQKMLDCTVASEMSAVLGEVGLDTMLEQSVGSVESDALIRGVLSIPADATEVTSVTVLGCSKESSDDLAGMAYEVVALVEVGYTDAEGEGHKMVVEEDFDLVNTGKGYKIYS